MKVFQGARASVGIVFVALLVFAILDVTMANFYWLASHQFLSCQNLETKADMDLERFQGHWVVQALFKSGSMGFHCTDFWIRPMSESEITIRQKSHIEGYKEPVYLDLYGTISNLRNATTWSVWLEDYGVTIIFQILDTDYNNYSVMYTCSNPFNSRIEFVWIMTREAVVTDMVSEKALEVAERFGFNGTAFEYKRLGSCGR